MSWLLGISAGILLALGVAAFHDYSYDEGYDARVKEEKDWWISADKEVDEARQQIWRKEAKKGRWV